MATIQQSKQDASAAEVTIALPEQFTFHDHRRFRAGYFNGKASGVHYVVDFGKTRFIDSAGLGMLLQLIEYAQSDRQRVHFVNCAPDIRQTLAVAGFEEAATIA